MVRSRDGYWIYVDGPKQAADECSVGKWIAEGSLERVIACFEEVAERVERGDILGAKYSHKQEMVRDAFSDWPPVLMVYADDTDRDAVKDILAGMGILSPVWKYDAQTARDWRKGGELYELQRSWELKNVPWYARWFRRVVQ